MFTVTGTHNGERHILVWRRGQLSGDAHIVALIRAAADELARNHGLPEPIPATMPEDLLSEDGTALAVIKRVLEDVSKPKGRMYWPPNRKDRVY